MSYDLHQVDSLVEQVKGNTNFLKKVLFSRAGLATAIVLSGLFLVAAFK